MDDALRDRMLIRELVEDWAVARDSGDWETLAACWHADGVMNATWFQGTVAEFIARCQASWARGHASTHFLGGTRVRLRGARAVAETKMTIASRMPVEGVACDVTCTGRFFDLLEKRAGRWGIVERQPIYEKDRIDPVEPGARPALDPALLARFPEGYRHLAYAQTRAGMVVKTDMPGLRGPEVAALMARGAAWLEGG